MVRARNKRQHLKNCMERNWNMYKFSYLGSTIPEDCRSKTEISEWISQANRTFRCKNKVIRYPPNLVTRTFPQMCGVLHCINVKLGPSYLVTKEVWMPSNVMLLQDDKNLMDWRSIKWRSSREKDLIVKREVFGLVSRYKWRLYYTDGNR